MALRRRFKDLRALGVEVGRLRAVVITKPSTEIPIDAALHASPAHPWVSRGGVKLAAALEQSGIDVKRCVCLDVGASTGGFSDVLLALIKPQFEASRRSIKKGIVRDPAIHDAVCNQMAAFVGSLKCTVSMLFPSEIAGGDGNREFFIAAHRD